MRAKNVSRLYLNVMLAQVLRRLSRVMNAQCIRNTGYITYITDSRYVEVCVCFTRPCHVRLS